MLGAPQPLAGLALLHLVKLDVGHIAVVEEKRFSVFLSAEFDAISSTGKSIKTVPIIGNTIIRTIFQGNNLIKAHITISTQSVQI